MKGHRRARQNTKDNPKIQWKFKTNSKVGQSEDDVKEDQVKLNENTKPSTNAPTKNPTGFLSRVYP